MYDIYLKKAIIMHIYDREILTQYTAVRSNALEAYKTTHIGWFNTFLSVTERIIGRTEGIISSLILVLLRKPPTRELRNSAEGRYTYFFPYRPVEKKRSSGWLKGLGPGANERRGREVEEEQVLCSPTWKSHFQYLLPIYIIQ